MELMLVMPWMPEIAKAVAQARDVPATAELLRNYQLQDFACIQASFNAAGIEITDPKALLVDKHVTAEGLQQAIDTAKLQKDIAGTFPA